MNRTEPKSKMVLYAGDYTKCHSSCQLGKGIKNISNGMNKHQCIHLYFRTEKSKKDSWYNGFGKIIPYILLLCLPACQRASASLPHKFHQFHDIQCNALIPCVFHIMCMYPFVMYSQSVGIHYYSVSSIPYTGWCSSLIFWRSKEMALMIWQKCCQVLTNNKHTMKRISFFFISSFVLLPKLLLLFGVAWTKSDDEKDE